MFTYKDNSFFSSELIPLHSFLQILQIKIPIHINIWELINIVNR